MVLGKAELVRQKLNQNDKCCWVHYYNRAVCYPGKIHFSALSWLSLRILLSFQSSTSESSSHIISLDNTGKCAAFIGSLRSNHLGGAARPTVFTKKRLLRHLAQPFLTRALAQEFNSERCMPFYSWYPSYPIKIYFSALFWPTNRV